MKKKAYSLLLAVPVLLSSCIISTHHYTTGNPIGTKEGSVTAKFIKDEESGVAGAAKKGGITKIGSVDITYYWSGKSRVIVTGE